MCFSIFKKKTVEAPAPKENLSNQAIDELNAINTRITDQMNNAVGARNNNAINKDVYRNDIANAAKGGISNNEADNNRVIEKAIEVSINLGQALG